MGRMGETRSWSRGDSIAAPWVLMLAIACGDGDGGEVGVSEGADTTTADGDGESGSAGQEPSTGAVAGSSDGGGSTSADMITDSGEEDTGGRIECPSDPLFDLVFAEQEGVDANLLALDVYPAPVDGPAPVVLFVHGGGWVMGDKSGLTNAPFALDFFADEGFTVVATNDRLITDPGSPMATWVDQPTDVAAALAWVSDRADELCIDASRISLVGHSAGAHIVALVASDPSYLGAHDIALDSLRGVVPLDVNAYDIPWAIENAADHGLPSSPNALQQVFGMDPRQHVAASPISHLDPANGHPPFLVVWTPVHSGIEQTLSQVASERYVERLLEVDADAQTFGAVEDDHASVASQLGRPGHAATEALRGFLETNG